MLTRDKYQEEKEEEARKCIEGLLSSIFENTERNVFVVSDDYYEDKVNRLYQVCAIAREFDLLGSACQKYGVSYEYKDYPYSHESQRYKRSMYVFTRLKKEKGLVRTNPLYPKYPHK